MQVKAIEVVPGNVFWHECLGRLYWICDSKPPQSQKEAFYFCIDSVNKFYSISQELVYQPFFEDFGPLNLGQMHSFCTELDKLMNNAEYKKAKIYHYCSENPKKKANAAFLMGAYQVIALKRTAKDAWKIFTKETFLDFRDAMKGICTYKCTVNDFL